MKKYIIPLIIVILSSCHNEDSCNDKVKPFDIPLTSQPQHIEQHHIDKVEVTFKNGDKDTLSLKSSGIRLEQGDLSFCNWANDWEWEVVASDVRMFKILNK